MGTLLTLDRYGWDAHFALHFEPLAAEGFRAGRVALEIKNHYRLLTAEGEVPARAAGKMFHDAAGKVDMPVVGDWVAFRMNEGPEPLGRIQHNITRRTKFSRKIAGSTTAEQPVAANIDVVFIMSGLDDNFNLRRIERYLALAWESGAQPVILLNKEDLCPIKQLRHDETQAIAGAAPVLVLSALYRHGLEQLDEFLLPGRTAAMLGSSGVGKTTLLNSLFGREMGKVGEIGVAGKGTHTTRTRKLYQLPSGAMIIDTPGMREIQLWNVDEGMADSFADIAAIGVECRFADCHHRDEPGCAVKSAVDGGRFDRDRYENYLRMRQEVRSLESRIDRKAMLERKSRDRVMQKALRKRLQEKGK
jgi:ribosome biogenesis GTPase